MPLGRIVSSCAAATAAAGCAVLALAMSQGGSPHPTAKDSPSSTRPPSLVHATAPAPVAPLATSSTPATRPATTSAPRTTTAAPKRTPVTPTTSRAPASTSGPPPQTTSHAAAPKQPASSTKAPAPKRGASLPLGYTTGSATKVITVVAHSTGSTTATLQAWTKAPGGGWLRYGSSVTAYIGSAGMTTHPSESLSATPMGSFTLTQAFGHKADPGTALPYFQTTSADWWISQENSLYNTHQRCSSGCGFTQGSPNEHLAAAADLPYYNYAVVIDYNTRNAPGGVHQGAGSAFFLHVHPPGTGPTAGCVAIPQDRLVPLMQWLTPGAHPRIMIGVD